MRFNASSLRKQDSAGLLEANISVVPQLVDGEKSVAVLVKRFELTRNDLIGFHAKSKGQLAIIVTVIIPNRWTGSLKGVSTPGRSCCD